MAELRLIAGFVSAVLLVVSAFVAAHRGSWALVGFGPFALRWAGTLVLGCWLATVGFHVLRPLGLFEPVPATLASLIVALGSMRLLGGTPTRQLLRRDARILRRLASGLRRPGSLALLALLPFVALRLLRCLFQPPLGWDTVAYHGPRAAIFVQTGAFTFDPGPGSWSLYRNFFAGGEVLWAWAMLPFHNDALVGLAGGALWLGVGLATWAFGRVLGLKEPYAGLAGMVALFVPTLQLTVPSGYVEPPLFFAILVSLACAVHTFRSPRPRVGIVVVGAMAGGLAAGVKLPGALPAAVACVFMFACVRTHRERWPHWGVVCAGVLAAVLPALPWIAHAWLDTGAPLSPMPVSVLGVPLGLADPHMQWFMRRDVSAAYTLGAEWTALETIFAWPRSGSHALGLLSAIPILLAPLGIARVFRGSRVAGAMLLAAVLAMWTVFYLPGFSLNRIYFAMPASRYLLGPALLGIPLCLWGLAARRNPVRALAAVLWATAAFHAVLYAVHGWGGHETLQLALGAAATSLVVGLLVGLLRNPTAFKVASALVVAGLAFAALRHSQLTHRYDAVRASVQLHGAPRYWARGAELLDQPGRSHRVAITSGPHQAAAFWFTYYFYGTEIQNRLHYVPVTSDGRIAHFGPDGQRRDLADREAWMARLSALDITHVVSLYPQSLEHQWMRDDPERFRRLEGGSGYGVFDVLPLQGRDREPGQ